MKIVWINDKAAQVGGCENYIFDTAKRLKQHGHQSTLLYDVTQRVAPSIHKHFEGAYPIVDIKHQLKALNPDVVYLHRAPHHLNPQELLDLPYPVIAFFHDHQLFCLREHKYSLLTHQTCIQNVGINCYTCPGFLHRQDQWPGIGISSLQKLKKLQSLYKQFDGFIVASDYMKQHIINHGFKDNKIHKIALSHQSSLVDSHTQKGELLFVGQLVRGKGLDILLKALPKVKKTCHLTIVGTGKQEHECKQLAQKLKIEQQVSFVGHKSSGELVDYYQRSQILIFPSRAPETFGLVGLEAMNYHLPVIASDVGGIREWLLEGKTGLTFPSGDSLTLAKTIDELLRNSEQLKQMGLAGKQRLEKFFKPEKHLHQLLNVFHQVKDKVEVAA